MTTKKIAEPYYDFEIEQITGEKLGEKYIFTSEVSIIKCTRGKATISINSHKHELRENGTFLLFDNLLFKVLTHSDDFLITNCRFSLRFFNEIYPMLDNKVINVLQYCTPDLFEEKELESADLMFRQLCILHQQKEYAYRERMVINTVVNYTFEMYNLTRKHIGESLNNIQDNGKSHIVDSFFELCSDKHTEHRNIGYYAEKLNISSRYLYKIIRGKIQSTPKEIIDFYVSGTAKRLLLSTVLTNQQVADNLNFPDQATFGQFFKRNVGMSPSEFRNRYK